MGENWPKTWPNMDKVHIFDPNGDVLLQLPNAIRRATGKTIPLVDEHPDLEPTDDEPVPPDGTSSPKVPLDVRAACNGESVASEEMSLASPPATCTDEDSASADYLQVSSKHLILASAVFRKMLGSDKFMEGRKLHSEGNLVLKLADDSEAMAILMDIIHGMTRMVPRNIPLFSLAKIAHLVNYYQLHEAVEVFSDMWIANLKEKIVPEKDDFPNAVLAWLFISWVFRKGGEFNKMTQILIEQGDEKLPEHVDAGGHCIPVPASILHKVQEHRIRAIARIISIIHGSINKYLTPSLVCHNDKLACDGVILGSLLKSSAAVGIWPRPEVPYPGMKFKTLALQVRQMEVLDGCAKQDYRSASHGIKSDIQSLVKALERKSWGLNLKLFLPETKKRKEIE